jgi:LytS/YehU family sensor histidine kinase
VLFYRRFREREHRALLLESNLTKARLGALRAQLQPHFLFNSLNAIATLLRRDPRQAEETLMSLSELLRLSLSQSEKQKLTLGEEMKFVERYLEIQRTRFGDKLHIELDIEPAALECLVPALLLQPLVENAIHHGIEPADRDGLVRLSAHRRDGRLVMAVEDDGVGLAQLVGNAGVQAAFAIPDPTAIGTGIGLSNLRARLQMLYGDNQSLRIISGAQGGVVVRIEIPYFGGFSRGAEPFRLAT